MRKVKLASVRQRSRTQATDHEYLPYCALFERGDSDAMFYPTGVEVPESCLRLADVVQELMFELEGVRAAMDDNHDLCLVLLMRTNWTPRAAAVTDLKDLKKSAKSLLKLVAGKGTDSVGPKPLMSPRNSKPGQLFGKVLLVEDVSLAHTLRDRWFLPSGATDPILQQVSVSHRDLSERGNLKSAIRASLARTPPKYVDIRSTLTRLDDTFRSEVGQTLEAPLNAHARSLPHETYEDKKELAKWVNAELRRFGLAIRCPKTGRPAHLVGNAGGQPGVGRFQLEIFEPTGERRQTVSSVQMPNLELIADSLEHHRSSPHGGRSR